MIPELIARFGPALVDVILCINGPYGHSTVALSCEISGHKSIREPGMNLTTFARQHFGSGTLRKVGTNHYAVLRGTPATQPATDFPTWMYHVS